MHRFRGALTRAAFVLSALAAAPAAHAGVVFTFSKSFADATIPLNGSTSLTFNIARLGPGPANGIGFTDNLPAGLVVSTPNGLAGACGGGSTVTAAAGSSSIALAGGTLAAGANCSFSVNVTGTTAGVKNNTTSVLNSSSGSAAAATATLTVLPGAGGTTAVPTLSEWALILLGAALGASALRRVRKG